MDATPTQTQIDNMTSTELKAHLAKGTAGGTTPSKTGKVKAKAVKASKPQKGDAAKARKTGKAKLAKASKPTKVKAKSKAPAKSKAKSKTPSIVSRIGDHLIANRGKAFKATDLAKRFKCRGVEVHRAVSRLERLGATVEATRSGPTGKPGRRTFLYSLTKNPSKS